MTRSSRSSRLRSKVSFPRKPDAPRDIELLRDNYLAKLENDLRVLPYHKLIVDSLGALPLKDDTVVIGDYGILPTQLFRPVLLELIWSYWHEEGMLVQTIDAISRRFQNRGTTGTRHDPLARFEIDPLRPLNTLIWGYVQDERNLLTVQRRAYEYQHEYGISQLGTAIPGFDPVDSRSRFLHALDHHPLAVATTSLVSIGARCAARAAQPSAVPVGCWTRPSGARPAPSAGDAFALTLDEMRRSRREPRAAGRVRAARERARRAVRGSGARGRAGRAGAAVRPSRGRG